MTYVSVFDSPCGALLLTSDGRAVTALAFEPQLRPPGAERADDLPVFVRLRAQLGDYFAGRPVDFDVEVAPVGTPFQQQVWSALRSIPYAGTASYGEIARRIGRPTASRAVGAANGRNPIAIIVPCHRVIGSDGSLTGYAGGAARKRLLLDLESGVRVLG